MNRIPIKKKCSGLGRTLLTISFCAYAANLFAQTTNLVSFTTFESDGRPRFSYPYHYTYGGADPGGSIESFNTFYYDPNDVGLTNAMGQFVFDDTVFNGFLAANPGGGFGYGFGGGANFDNDTSKFIGTNREDYIVSFDCRVEGLQPGTTSANGEFQIRFDAPDDTIQPPDGDGNSDTLMQVNIGFTATSNLTHYVFTLDQGGLGGGSADDFATYKSAINNINFAMNWNNPEAFGYDGDNAIYIDNVKLEAIQKGALRLLRPPLIYPSSIGISMTGPSIITTPIRIRKTTNRHSRHRQFMRLSESAIATQMSSHSTIAFSPANRFRDMPEQAAAFPVPWIPANSLRPTCRLIGLTSITESWDSTQANVNSRSMQSRHSYNGTALLTLNFDVSVKTNWQTFSSTLNKGANGGGSVAAFAQNLTNINSIQPNFQVTGVLGDFGFDNDNYVIIDNVSLVRLQLGLPPLTITRSNNTVIVTWSGPAKLQGANNVVGPYTDLTGVTNSCTSDHRRGVSSALNGCRSFRQ